MNRLLPGQSSAQADHQHARVAPGSVDTVGIQDGAVTTAKIADAAITTVKIADGQVTLAKLVAAVQEALTPTGAIVAYAGTTAPTGWLLCNGAAVSRTTYAALFAVAGVAFGAGDGSTTFNLPDLRQRFPLGKAASGTGATLGGTGGTIDHVHGLDNSSAYAKVANTTVAPGLFIERQTSVSWTADRQSASASNAASTAAQVVGAKLAGNTDTGNPPFQAVNYLVKT